MFQKQGVARYYYWNTETDEVCWLSPTHPKAKITAAACRVAKSTSSFIIWMKHANFFVVTYQDEWEAITKENAKRPQIPRAKESLGRKRRDSYESDSAESDVGTLVEFLDQYLII